MIVGPVRNRLTAAASRCLASTSFSVFSHDVSVGRVVSVAVLALSVNSCAPSESTNDLEQPSGDHTADAGTSDPLEATDAAGVPGDEVGDEVLAGDDPEAISRDASAPAEECVGVTAAATQSRQPVDIVLVVDNSESMDEEIDAIEFHINQNFAEVLNESAVDYRVIIFSGYRVNGFPGTHMFAGNRVCVGPPLGPSECDSRPASAEPHHDRLFHFDQPVGSWDAPCLLLDRLFNPPAAEDPDLVSQPTRADDPLVQDGWSAFLREDSHKAFIVFSDDEVRCSFPPARLGDGFPNDFALDFASILQQAAPEWFGDVGEESRFSWHSVIGLAGKDDVDAIYEPSDPIVSEPCESARDPGLDYQALSVLTNGMRYPVCGGLRYELLFQRAAAQVTETSLVDCSWTIPDAPDGRIIDVSEVNVSYTTADGQAGPDLFGVANAAACGDFLAWYYDDLDAPEAVQACPAMCELISGGSAGTVDISFGCATRTIEIK